MAKIKIGADELILWLRKHEKGVSIPNGGSQGLGRKICELIVNQLGGKKVEDSKPSYWANVLDDENIGKFDLPAHAAQYEIDSSQLENLYIELNNW